MPIPIPLVDDLFAWVRRDFPRRWPLLLPFSIPTVVFPFVLAHWELTVTETFSDPDLFYWSGVVLVGTGIIFVAALLPYWHNHPRFWKRLAVHAAVGLVLATLGVMAVLAARPSTPNDQKPRVGVLRLQDVGGKGRDGSESIFDKLFNLVSARTVDVEVWRCVNRWTRRSDPSDQKEEAIRIANSSYLLDFVIYGPVGGPHMAIAKPLAGRNPSSINGGRSPVEPTDVKIDLGHESRDAEKGLGALLGVIQGLRYYQSGDYSRAQRYFHDSATDEGSVYEGLCYYWMALDADSKKNPGDPKSNLEAAMAAYERVIAKIKAPAEKEETLMLVAALVNAANVKTDLAASAATVDQRLCFQDAEKYCKRAVKTVEDYLNGKGLSQEAGEALRAEMYRWEYEMNLGSLYLDWSQIEEGQERKSKLEEAKEAFEAAKKDLEGLGKDPIAQAKLPTERERDLIIANNGLAVSLSRLAWPGQGEKGRNYLHSLRSVVTDLNRLLFSGAHEELRDVRTGIELNIGGALTTLAQTDDCISAKAGIIEAIFHYQVAIGLSRLTDSGSDGTAEVELASALSMLADFADANEKETLLIKATALLEEVVGPAKGDWITLDRLASVKRKLAVLLKREPLLDEAVKRAREALSAEQETDGKYNQALAYSALARILIEKGRLAGNTSQLAEAEQNYKSALQIWTRDVDPGEVAAANAGLGDALTGRATIDRDVAALEQAVNAYGEALSIYAGDGDWRERVGTLTLRAKAARELAEFCAGNQKYAYLLAAIGDLDSSTVVLAEKGYPAGRAAQVRNLIAAARSNVSATSRDPGNLSGAISQIDQAIAILQKDSCYSGVGRSFE